MKILIINQAFFPDTVATAQHVSDVALQLSREGHQVSVVADSRNYANRSLRYRREERLGEVRVHRIPTTGFGKGSLLRRVVDATSFFVSLCWALLRVPRPDVMIAFTSPPMLGVVVLAFSWIRRVRCIQWMMDLNPHTAVEVGYLKRDGIVAKALFALFELSVRRSDHVVVLDKWMRERLLGHGVPERRISIIPPWPIDRGDAPEKGFAENPFRARYGLQEKFVVLYSGNHSIAHPLDTLLEAARRLRRRDDVVFLFVGSGLRVREVSDFSDHHDLSNIVQLPHQPVEMLRHLLAAADVHVVVMGENVGGLVHPSKIYGVLAAGKPYLFIGPEDSYVTDLLSDFPGGRQIDHGRADVLEKAIVTLADASREERSILCGANPTEVFRRFSKENLVGKFHREVLVPQEARGN